METITLTRIGAVVPATRDAQGNPARSTPVEIESAGWYVAGNNGGAEVPVELGESDVMTIRIYNHTVVDVRSSDQVTVRGRVWKVVGDVEPWESPFGSTLGGTAVTLRRAG